MRRQFGTSIMMRTWIASLLMATTLAPVAASAQDAGGSRDGRRGEWSLMRGDAGQSDAAVAQKPAAAKVLCADLLQLLSEFHVYFFEIVSSRFNNTRAVRVQAAAS